MKQSKLIARSFIALFAAAASVLPVLQAEVALAEFDQESLGIMDRDLPSARSKDVSSILGDRVSNHDTQKNTALVRKSLYEEDRDAIAEQKRLKKALRDVSKDDMKSGGRDSDAKLTRKVQRHTQAKKIKVVNRAEEDKLAEKAAKKAAKKKKQDQKRAAALARKNPF